MSSREDGARELGSGEWGVVRDASRWRHGAPEARRVAPGAMRTRWEALRVRRIGVRATRERSADGESNAASCVKEDECRWKDYTETVENHAMRRDRDADRREEPA
jgi:hypothetical protein